MRVTRAIVQSAGLVAVLAAGGGCSQNSSTRTSVLATQETFVAPPTPHSLFKTYPVSVAFSRNGPTLTSAQRAWIRQVIHSKNYGPLRARLRFATVAGPTRPLVIYVNKAGPSQADRGGHVIGEGCNVLFDPVEHGVFPATGASCTPPTPKPV